MSYKIKKIGSEKTNLFNKEFDKVYDYWKQKAINDHNYHGELKLIKEHNKIIICILIDDVDQFTERPIWDDDSDSVE